MSDNCTPTQKKWLSDIKVPDMGLSGTMAYIDRMVSGTGPKGNQYRNHKPQQSKLSGKKRKSFNSNQSVIKKPLSNQESFNIDHADWLEARKNKFPKCSPQFEDLGKKSQPRVEEIKRKERRKSLFEKLID